MSELAGIQPTLNLAAFVYQVLCTHSQCTQWCWLCICSGYQSKTAIGFWTETDVICLTQGYCQLAHWLLFKGFLWLFQMGCWWCALSFKKEGGSVSKLQASPHSSNKNGQWGHSGQGLEAREAVQDHSERVHKRHQITEAEYGVAR